MKIKNVKLTDLIPYDKNPYSHNAQDLAIVKQSILDNSYVEPIVVWKNNVIIAGHLRYMALSEIHPNDEDIEVIDASHLTEGPE